ncbi:hypothetical protein A9G48_08175 [Gilliamella sp. wkB18]|uniref:cytochrome b n=1 Tax=Gilliamella sp. wkB18 TaxID=3120260 RepID=UPI0004DD55B2|nr:cytochrome b [Gilliamella apicola]KFA59200.1 Cytochrome B561 [Gilliamella apicola]OCG62564.1 hypothetical protein A9G48_08175 [Gilliamella apicola]
MQNYPQYSVKQKWIHWLSAICVLMTFLLIAFKGSMSYYLGGMPNIYLLHKSFGIVIVVLTVWRILVVIFESSPNLLSNDNRLLKILSKSVQGFIYIFLLIVPISGYLMSSRDFNVFGVISIPAIDMPNKFYTFFYNTHILTSFIFMILLLLHVIGAMYHYFFLKDKVLQSML